MIQRDVQPAALATGWTLVLIFWVAPTAGCRGCHRQAMMMSGVGIGPPPQSRPARTLVLIFMVRSFR
jgi:hypothetical protein